MGKFTTLAFTNLLCQHSICSKDFMNYTLLPQTRNKLCGIITRDTFFICIRRSMVRHFRLTIVAVVILLSACATGSVLVTGQIRNPIEVNQVIIYVEAPENYEIIGLVKASYDHGLTEQSALDEAKKEFIKQAAMVGANGIILDRPTSVVNVNMSKNPQSNQTTMTWSSETATLSGIAIFVGK